MATESPITSVAPPSSNPITSVSVAYPSPPIYSNNQRLLSRLNLDLRGRIFPVDRETLMLLPESVLLGLFPQGLILSKPASWEGADDGLFTVDVSVLATLHQFFRLDNGRRRHFPDSSVVRPGLFPIHPRFLVHRPICILRYPYLSRSIPRSTIHPFLTLGPLIRPIPEPPLVETSHHRPPRRARILLNHQTRCSCQDGSGDGSGERRIEGVEERVWEGVGGETTDLYGFAEECEQGE